MNGDFYALRTALRDYRHQAMLVDAFAHDLSAIGDGINRDHIDRAAEMMRLLNARLDRVRSLVPASNIRPKALNPDAPDPFIGRTVPFAFPDQGAAA
jgi:hypothetical protein